MQHAIFVGICRCRCVHRYEDTLCTVPTIFIYYFYFIFDVQEMDLHVTVQYSSTYVISTLFFWYGTYDAYLHLHIMYVYQSSAT